MAIENDPRPVLRQELSRIFKNQRVIRAFEKIFDLVPPEFINQQDQIDDLASQIQTDPTASGISNDELLKQLADLQQGPVI